MSEKEAIEKIKAAQELCYEDGHVECDNVLVVFIRSLGYNDLADAYAESSKAFEYSL